MWPRHNIYGKRLHKKIPAIRYVGGGNIGVGLTIQDKDIIIYIYSADCSVPPKSWISIMVHYMIARNS